MRRVFRLQCRSDAYRKRMREKRLDRKTLRLQHSCKKVSANAEQAHFLAEWACLFISTILSGKHKSAHRNLSHSQSRYRSRGVGAGNVNQLPSSQLEIWPEHSLDCQNLPWSHKWQVETMVPEVSWHLVENFIQYLMWMTHDTYNFFFATRIIWSLNTVKFNTVVRTYYFF